ncbi:methyl-accepting chemotaxis protein [Brevibacillus ruminantium]|uniref:Methyl-accepting chemotaxis protein n=1 Tax=Brevibacillus ruminantium TaxID=2950604 RepID=A0ABY4WEA5_9BACL|nr:methyl-accepting chemotaxis protein [Brevibacillus ruminantium]USG65510.1 methyl-accepting chemotaxis protein [Brevibacillus ruminantium]
MRLFNKLRHKIVLWFLLLAVLPLILNSYLIITDSTNILIEKQKLSTVHLTESTAQAMDQWLDRRLSEVMVLARSSDIQSDDAEAKNQFIRKFTDEIKLFDGNTFISSDGIVRADTFPGSVGISLKDRPFYQQGMEGKTSYSDMLIAKTTGNRSIVVAAPVVNNAGMTLGVLTGLVNVDSFLSTFLHDLDLGEGGYPILVDHNGLIQAHPDPELIGKSIEEASLPEGLGSILKNGAPSAGSSIYSDSGKEYLVTFAAIPQTGYSLFFHLPISTITAEVWGMVKNITLICSIITAIILTAAFFVSRQISRPIAEVSVIAGRISEGDLAVEPLTIKSRDEVGQLSESVNQMVGNLRSIIQQVNSSAEELAASAEELSANAEETSKATEQIASSIQEVAYGAEQQVHSVSESVGTIDAVSKGIQQIASNAEHAADTANSASQIAANGNDVIQTVMHQMQLIHATVNDIASIIKRLGESSQEIGQIVQVITAIAQQTNLLSLNAAIEAARAGEHGRGFAVVADEVRKLAEESAKSAQQIEQLITAIQAESNQAVHSMEKGTREVALGIDVVNEAGKSFVQIRDSVSQVATQIHEVQAYSLQMTKDTEQVVHLVGQISKVAENAADGTQNVSAATEEQLAAVQQVTSSAESLAKVAEDLQDQVRKFILYR